MADTAASTEPASGARTSDGQRPPTRATVGSAPAAASTARVTAAPVVLKCRHGAAHAGSVTQPLDARHAGRVGEPADHHDAVAPAGLGRPQGQLDDVGAGR